MKSGFFQPRFDGERFSEHTLPLEVAGDLAAYEMLVVELAKHLYLKDNPDRQRVPKGFTTGFQLHLEKIEDGCSRPLLSIVTAGALALTGGTNNYFEQARDLITQCVASTDAALPADFPKYLLAHFNQIGRSLRENESMELPRSGNPPATLTPERRKNLVLAAEKVYEREIELAGTIGEADWEKSTFRLRMTDGTLAVVPMPESFHLKAREFGGRPRFQVSVKGIGTFDSWDKLQKVISVNSLEIQPNYQIAGKLDELSALKDGWHDGQGRAIDSAKLTVIYEKMVNHYPERFSLPVIVPTTEGNLLLEWDLPSNPSVDLRLSDFTATFHAFVPNGKEIEQEFALQNQDGWNHFFAFLDGRLDS